MGVIRSLLFRYIYPLPQKDEDLLVHKQEFIKEYADPYLLAIQIKRAFVPHKIRDSACYIKKQNDKEQKVHLEAYKTWRKVVSARQRS